MRTQSLSLLILIGLFLGFFSCLPRRDGSRTKNQNTDEAVFKELIGMDLIAITVPNLEKALNFFEAIGCSRTRDVKIATVDTPKFKFNMQKNMNVEENAVADVNIVKCGDGARIEVFQFTMPVNQSPANLEHRSLADIGGISIHFSVAELAAAKKSISDLFQDPEFTAGRFISSPDNGEFWILSPWGLQMGFNESSGATRETKQAVSQRGYSNDPSAPIKVNVQRIDKFSVTVPSLDKGAKFFQALGCKLTGVGRVMQPTPRQVLSGERIVSDCQLTTKLEMLEFSQGNLKQGRFPKNSEIGGHHIDLKVENVYKALDFLKSDAVKNEIAQDYASTCQENEFFQKDNNRCTYKILGEPTFLPKSKDEGQDFVLFLSPWGMQIEMFADKLLSEQLKLYQDERQDTANSNYPIH